MVITAAHLCGPRPSLCARAFWRTGSGVFGASGNWRSWRAAKKWITEYDEDHITKEEFEEKMGAVEKATREVEARMPVTPPPLLNHRAVNASLVRALARFRTWRFDQQRASFKRVVRSFQVIDGAIPDFTLSGAFLGELAHTNSAQCSIALCNFGVPANIVLLLPEPIRLQA